MADNNNGGNSGNGEGGNGGNGAGGNGEGGGQGGESKDIQIPKFRFDEEAKARQVAEAKLKKFEEAEEERAKKEAEAKGEWEKVATTEKEKREQAEQKLNKTVKTNVLKLAALQAGAVDVDTVVAISNLDGITVAEDGTVDDGQIKALVEKLKTDKGYLFGKAQNQNIGADGGAGEGGNGTTPTFKRSQLGDRQFYLKNRDAIIQAEKEGKIIDDVTKA